MKNIAVMVGLLVGAFALAWLLGAHLLPAGRIGIAAVFAFTAVGHFLKPRELAAMLPPRVPARLAIVLWSGLLEGILAILVLLPAYSRVAGLGLCVFLVLVTPVNVHAAIAHVDFGGHGAGPRYLLIRLPLQLVLLVWIYWFAVRPA
jgi:uncharacterized membrane protein